MKDSTNIQIIQNCIHTIRNERVMLDFDLAEMYEVENRALKQAVKRNLDRFPVDFMFKLTPDEWTEVITNCDNLQVGVKFSPTTSFSPLFVTRTFYLFVCNEQNLSKCNSFISCVAVA
jgi:hypothetical protein